MSIPKPITARQMKKLVSLVTGAIPSDLSSELAQKWTDNKMKKTETSLPTILKTEATRVLPCWSDCP